jgi:hypothetical protein
MKYMLLMVAPSGGWKDFLTMTPAEIAGHVEFMKGVNAKLSEAGELVDAQGLDVPDHAKIVRAGARGEAVVTDGPFAEAKEFLAGYWIVDVESPARAIEIAAYISTAPGRGGVPINLPVEVRQVMSAAPGEDM